ncbi:hypothetical protein EYY60_13420 [Flavobacterium zhairuonense]|uniref:hypothetical protein n=1 Tax=Flavobacterium zhairuonense TaxID=2493631 RepID=UPI00104E1911|nr:hypothetical protein [Flavobacterium zhairuonense]KAF2509375.1 hypothetical protein EYY60_13420 [Flavobacterium zhairuonense]
MKKEDFWFSDKQLKKALRIVIAIFAIFLFVRSFIIDTDKKRHNNGLKSIKEESFQGVVVDKGFEKLNHNASMIYLNDETKFAVFGQFWPKIKIGDSVVKKSGETIITVYRNNEKFILDNKEIFDSFK